MITYKYGSFIVIYGYFVDKLRFFRQDAREEKTKLKKRSPRFRLAIIFERMIIFHNFSLAVKLLTIQ